MVDSRLSSRQIFQKGRGAGGSAALEPTMPHAKGRDVSSLHEGRSDEPSRYSTGTVRSLSCHDDARRGPEPGYHAGQVDQQ